MGRAIRFLSLALILAASTLTTGCNLRSLHVVIPDFEASQVSGVNIWSVDTGQPVGAGSITFGPVTTQNLGAGPVELIEYSVTRVDGSQLTLSAQVIRDPAVPGGIEVYLLFPKEVPSGNFKVSTFNTFGSSPLSAEQTYLL